MALSPDVRQTRWAAVLAGGRGARMQPMIRDWLGHDRPKQYCTFVGTRSMLQHTLDRTAAIVPRDNILTVIARDHRPFLGMPRAHQMAGIVIEQPTDRGTAAGVFLPAAFILERDPEATAFILPSDHFIFPEDRFLHHLMFADLLTRQFPDRLIMLGASPDRPETDYGWIVPGASTRSWVSHRFVPDPQEVWSFKEKPSQAEARNLYRAGALWNTMIVVSKVRALWDLGWTLLPELMPRFEEIRLALRRRGADHTLPSVLDRAYRSMEPVDLSRDILQRADRSTLVLAMNGVDWSDWGRPQRVAETLLALGKVPAFPIDVLDARLPLVHTPATATT